MLGPGSLMEAGSWRRQSNPHSLGKGSAQGVLWISSQGWPRDTFVHAYSSALLIKSPQKVHVLAEGPS